MASIVRLIILFAPSFAAGLGRAPSALALLQTRADVVGHPHEAKKKKGKRTSVVTDIDSRLVAIHDAVQAVEDLVAMVNATTTEALASAVRAGRGLTTALVEAKDSVSSLSLILGQDVFNRGSTLYDRLSSVLEAQPEEAADSEERMQALLRDILREFRAAGLDSVREFHDARYAVAKIEKENHRELALTQQDASAGSLTLNSVLQWFYANFGRAGTPCEKAKAAIGQADKTVTHMTRMLLTVNSSLCASMLEGAQQSIGMRSTMLREEMETGAATYGSDLPSSLLSMVTEAVETTCIVMDHTHNVTVATETQVVETVGVALEELTSVHGTSEELYDALDAVMSRR
jgi:hypothetical protein